MGEVEGRIWGGEAGWVEGREDKRGEKKVSFQFIFLSIRNTSFFDKFANANANRFLRSYLE